MDKHLLHSLHLEWQLWQRPVTEQVFSNLQRGGKCLCLRSFKVRCRRTSLETVDGSLCIVLAMAVKLRPSLSRH